MAKFRIDHQRGRGSGPAALIRVLALVSILFMLIYLGLQWIKSMPLSTPKWTPARPEARFFLPAADSATRVLHHPWYSAGVSGETGAFVWAAFEWDARMEQPEMVPDTLFTSLPGSLKPVWNKWMKKGEEATRRLGRLFTVTGPVSDGFFIAWLDEGTSELQAVGLIFTDENPVVSTVDSIETLTGLDLFAEYWLDSLESKVEKNVNIEHWAPQIP